MVTCLIGPDSMGSFQREQVPQVYAESCDRERCICTNHENYAVIAEQRIVESQSLDQKINQLLDDWEEETNPVQIVEVPVVVEEKEEEEEEPEEKEAISVKDVTGIDAKQISTSGGKIPILQCKFGKDKNGVELNAEIDLIKFDLICSGQSFSEDFCHCKIKIEVEVDEDVQMLTKTFSILTLIGYALLIAWLIFIFAGAYHMIIRK